MDTLYAMKTKQDMNTSDIAAQIRTPEECFLVHCTESIEHAFLADGSNFYRRSWLRKQTQKQSVLKTDAQLVDELNSHMHEAFPDVPRVQQHIIGKLKRGMTEIYLHPQAILVPEDQLRFARPDHLFLQRVTPTGRTFDALMFHAGALTTILAIPKSQLKILQTWYNQPLFMGGADPLPLTFIKQQVRKGVDNSKIVEALMGDQSDSDSEWLPSESDEDLTEDEDDPTEDPTEDDEDDSTDEDEDEDK
tara:strand:+ start:46119 stop:46862 length:744 start_codon:yes stop_codon:yes gene_type:complete